MHRCRETTFAQPVSAIEDSGRANQTTQKAPSNEVAEKLCMIHDTTRRRNKAAQSIFERVWSFPLITPSQEPYCDKGKCRTCARPPSHTPPHKRHTTETDISRSGYSCVRTCQLDQRWDDNRVKGAPSSASPCFKIILFTFLRRIPTTNPFSTSNASLRLERNGNIMGGTGHRQPSVRTFVEQCAARGHGTHVHRIESSKIRYACKKGWKNTTQNMSYILRLSGAQNVTTHTQNLKRFFRGIVSTVEATGKLSTSFIHLAGVFYNGQAIKHSHPPAG